MSNRDWAALGFRLLGFWFIASAAIDLTSLPRLWRPALEQLQTGGTLISQPMVFTILPMIVGGSIGVALWIKAEWLAGRVFATTGAAENSAKPFPQEPLFTLAAIILGVVLINEALSGLVLGLSQLAVSRLAAPHSVFGQVPYAETQQTVIWNATAKATTFAAMVRGVLGLILLLRPDILRAAATARKRTHTVRPANA
jgi:hypothetical protein